MDRGDGHQVAQRTVLPLEFYARDTLIVARELLGQRLVRMIEGVRLSGHIVEVEAYQGEDDLASHAARGKTLRNAVMFGPPGHAYVYFTYGMHYCLNVVTEPEGTPAAVLIRAIAPIEGLEMMRQNRPGQPDEELTNGPAKLCQALRIDRTCNGVPLTEASGLFIERDQMPAIEQIATSPRIGVRGDERALTIPWRFFIRDHPYVSLKEGRRRKPTMDSW
ncbi:MAG: DNA-3-methyladenine glycosylase [Anaerolineae bacterium]|nr:DNA-3-methyladenine glycosylase [Anaerolineae bacterium]MDW8098642.1 DNA-3-methyladenine glycosylase [Anaerolineae bacterium]